MSYWHTRFFALFLFALWGGACGGEESADLECGPGTHAVGGQCVLICGAGTVYDSASSTCVNMDSTDCGEGTTFDEASDSCVPSGSTDCGEGTQLVDGECVATGGDCAEHTELDDQGRCAPVDTICATGTRFDAGQGTCIPDGEITCGDGTFLTDESLCVPEPDEAEVLAAQADLEEADGTELATPDIGEELIFTGIADDDGTSTFDFEAQAGQWFAITVHSLGLPMPTFTVTGSNDFARHSPRALHVSPTRQIVVPSDGTLQIEISSSLLGDDHNTSTWDFVAVLESLDPPTPNSLSVGTDPVTGTVIDLKGNLFQLTDLDDADTVELSIDTLGADAQGRLQIWSDGESPHTVHELSEGQVLSLDSPDDSTRVLVDYASARGADLDYAMSAQPGIDTILLPPNSSWTTTLDVDPGELVTVRQDNPDARTLFAEIHRDDELVTSNSNLYASTDEEAPPRQARLLAYAEDGDQWTLTVTNDHPTGIDEVQLFVDTRELEQLGSFGQGDSLERTFEEAIELHDSDFFVLEADGPVSIQGEVVPDLGIARAGFYQVSDMLEVTTSTSEFVTGLSAGTNLVEIFADEFLPLGYSLNAEFIEGFHVDLEVSAEPGELIQLYQSSTDVPSLDGVSFEAVVSKDDQIVVAPVQVSAEFDMVSRQGGLRWYSEAGGTYQVDLIVVGSILEQDIDIDHSTILPLDLGALSIDQQLDESQLSEAGFAFIHLTEPMRLTGEVGFDPSSIPGIPTLDPHSQVSVAIFQMGDFNFPIFTDVAYDSYHVPFTTGELPSDLYLITSNQLVDIELTGLAP